MSFARVSLARVSVGIICSRGLCSRFQKMCRWHLLLHQTVRHYSKYVCSFTKHVIMSAVLFLN